MDRYIFEAKTPRHLDICLRMLYSERQAFFVEIKETDKGKIVYAISITADEQIIGVLKEKYRILIS